MKTEYEFYHGTSYRVAHTLLYLLLFFFCTTTGGLQAQEEPVYNYRPAIDLPITGVGSGLVGLSFYLRSKEGPLNLDFLNNLNKDNINFIDRPAAGNIAGSGIDKLSDIVMLAPLSFTFLNFADQRARKDFATISLLYLEAFAISGSFYSLTSTFTNRKRPFAFNDELSTDKRTSSDVENAFFSGHVTVSATASFFAAKLFNDYHPHSKWRYPVWGVAAAVPMVTAYTRYALGKHFPTDVLTGYLVGAGSSILVLELHKNDDAILRNANISPMWSPNARGVHFSMRF